MSTAGHEERVRSLLSDLPPGMDSELLHLLTCPACRKSAIERLQGRQDEEDLPSYEEMWSRLHSKVPWMIDEAARRKAETEVLLGDLLSRPRQLRAKVLLEAPHLTAPDLLEASKDAQLREPEKAVVLADLALYLAGRFLREEAVETAGTAQCARASILKGNAHRLLGNLALAEDALVRGAYFLSWPFESCDRGELCRILGLVRWEQGRLDEAVGMLRQAARTFAERCLPQEEAASLVLCGLLSLERSRADTAIRFLQNGTSRLDRAARPWLTVRAGLGLALALAEIGEEGRARSVLNETWRQYARVRDEREQVRICWLEGRVWARLGQRDEAEQLLAAARRNLIAEYSLAESVLCSLDLAVVLVESGRAVEMPRLLDELEETFVAEHSALDVTRRVWGQLIAEAEGGQEVPRGHAVTAAATLRRVFRVRGYSVERLPFA